MYSAPIILLWEPSQLIDHINKSHRCACSALGLHPVRISLLALLFISDDDRKFDFVFAHLSDLVGSRDRDYTNRPFVTSSKSVSLHCKAYYKRQTLWDV